MSIKKQNFIRKFDNQTDYEAFTGSTDFIRPNVSACVAEKEIRYNHVEINVDSVSLNETAMTLNQGNVRKLVATVLPSNAQNKGVSWSSDDTDVATVDTNGKIIAVGTGACIITVTTDDGGKTATCEITVNAN